MLTIKIMHTPSQPVPPPPSPTPPKPGTIPPPPCIPGIGGTCGGTVKASKKESALELGAELLGLLGVEEEPCCDACAVAAAKMKSKKLKPKPPKPTTPGSGFPVPEGGPNDP